MANNSVLKQFSRYVSQNVLGMIGFSCYVLADTFFIAQAVGPIGLTALNFSLPIFSVLSGFGLMFGIGGATRYSINKNGEGEEGDNSALFCSIIMGAVVSLVFFVAAAFFVTPLAGALGADAEALPLTTVYMKTFMWFAPLFILNNIVVAFVRNDNDPNLAMAAMLISSFSNILFDYIFVFPLNLGMFGAALATGISPAISLCFLAFHFKKPNNHLRFKAVKIEFAECRQIMFFGFSSFIGELASATTLLIFNLVILRIAGNIGVAAYGIVANTALVATAVFTGMSQGIQPLASEWYGLREWVKIKKLLSVSVVTSVLASVVIYLTLFFTSGIIVSLFNSENNSILTQLAQNGLDIYFLGFFFAGLNIIAAAFLSAIAHPKAAFLISILRSCVVIIPAVFLLSTLFKINGVWLSFVVTELIVSVFSLAFLFKTFKNIEGVLENR